MKKIMSSLLIVSMIQPCFAGIFADSLRDYEHTRDAKAETPLTRLSSDGQGSESLPKGEYRDNKPVGSAKEPDNSSNAPSMTQSISAAFQPTWTRGDGGLVNPDDKAKVTGMGMSRASNKDGSSDLRLMSVPWNSLKQDAKDQLVTAAGPASELASKVKAGQSDFRVSGMLNVKPDEKGEQKISFATFSGIKDPPGTKGSLPVVVASKGNSPKESSVPGKTEAGSKIQVTTLNPLVAGLIDSSWVKGNKLVDPATSKEVKGYSVNMTKQPDGSTNVQFVKIPILALSDNENGSGKSANTVIPDSHLDSRVTITFNVKPTPSGTMNIAAVGTPQIIPSGAAPAPAMANVPANNPSRTTSSPNVMTQVGSPIVASQIFHPSLLNPNLSLNSEAAKTKGVQVQVNNSGHPVITGTVTSFATNFGNKVGQYLSKQYSNEQNPETTRNLAINTLNGFMMENKSVTVTLSSLNSQDLKILDVSQIDPINYAVFGPH